jgi:tetratricopeptide (TPR) repeat protein
VEHIRQALKLSRQSGQLDDETAHLVDLGNLYFQDNRFIDARDIFLTAEPLTISTGNTFPALAVANNLGLICRNLGEFDRALAHLRQAEKLVTAEDARAAQFISWSIGSVLHAAGAYEEALLEFNRGLRIAAGISYSEALALLGLCGVNRSLGNLTDSLDQGRRALILARRHELRFIECDVLSSLQTLQRCRSRRSDLSAHG